ncbi:MAG TPA: hypothetical protein VIR57_13320 [Chloroflexota bacterium]
MCSGSHLHPGAGRVRQQRAGFAERGAYQPSTRGIRGGAQCKARDEQRARGERQTLDRRAAGW